MSNAEQQAWAARQLLAGNLHGMLSTLSTEHPGYPFGSMAPYIVGHDGLPLFLLSHLSQHTRNIIEDPRCGLLLVENGEGDVQQLGRLSAPGELRPANDATGDHERYFRYFPQTRVYFEQLGFRFFRFHPLRFHWNGGFATARWFGNERIVRTNPFASGEIDFIGRLQHERDDALRLMLQPRPDATLPRIIGIDGEGVDVHTGASVRRLALSSTVDSFDALLESTATLAHGDRD
ncbi:MAG: pyridoxamine 5'-phosphate oxidase family protein [Gammaproteobacteria bacterium]|nr:pyridoxamine 5'-phosphate oxidase family protein [Gammaproteobacteria bacterium]